MFTFSLLPWYHPLININMCMLANRCTSYQAIWLYHLFLSKFGKVVLVGDWFNFEVVVYLMLIPVFGDLIFLLLELRGRVLGLELLVVVVFI